MNPKTETQLTKWDHPRATVQTMSGPVAYGEWCHELCMRIRRGGEPARIESTMDGATRKISVVVKKIPPVSYREERREVPNLRS